MAVLNHYEDANFELKGRNLNVFYQLLNQGDQLQDRLLWTWLKWKNHQSPTYL
jgi:hypothetical protein